MVGHMTKHMTHGRSWDTEIMTCRHISHVPLTTVRRLLNVGTPIWRRDSDGVVGIL